MRIIIWIDLCMKQCQKTTFQLKICLKIQFKQKTSLNLNWFRTVDVSFNFSRKTECNYLPNYVKNILEQTQQYCIHQKRYSTIMPLTKMTQIDIYLLSSHRHQIIKPSEHDLELNVPFLIAESCLLIWFGYYFSGSESFG